MKKHDEISDEMLARYLNGQGSPEEEARVLDYMAESDENLDDLLAIAAAAELVPHASRPYHRRLWPAISAAASIALLIGMGIALLRPASGGLPVGIDPTPAYAAQDTITIHDREEGRL